MHTTLFDWNPIICKHFHKFIYFLPPSQVLCSQYPSWIVQLLFQWCTVQCCHRDRRRQTSTRGSCLLTAKFFHFDHSTDQKSELSPSSWKSKNGLGALPWSARKPSIEATGNLPLEKFLNSPLTVRVLQWQCHVILQAVYNNASWRSGQRYGQQPRCTQFEPLEKLIIFTWWCMHWSYELPYLILNVLSHVVQQFSR